MMMNFMIMISLTFMIMYLKHPMSIGMNLIIQTLNISMLTYMTSNMSWFSFMLFIMMLGGLMILFIYIISISSNEKFKFSFNMMLIMIIFILMLMIIKNMFNINSINMLNMNFNMMKFNNTIFLMKLFNFNSMMLTIFLVMYLLMTMIIVTYIINIFEGPLRKKN
uniref:NADH dehydrogenase subunit 6 n=1 Tax=Stenopirates sp. PJ-2015 TaxID=1663424 RepID=A0A342D279_9HEMI|nr:NADH dehydrogenase subunit 6 [Stenopirates sp. PJ-2015]